MACSARQRVAAPGGNSSSRIASSGAAAGMLETPGCTSGRPYMHAACMLRAGTGPPCPRGFTSVNQVMAKSRDRLERMSSIIFSQWSEGLRVRRVRRQRRRRRWRRRWRGSERAGGGSRVCRAAAAASGWRAVPARRLSAVLANQRGQERPGASPAQEGEQRLCAKQRHGSHQEAVDPGVDAIGRCTHGQGAARGEGRGHHHWARQCSGCPGGSAAGSSGGGSASEGPGRAPGPAGGAPTRRHAGAQALGRPPSPPEQMMTMSGAKTAKIVISEMPRFQLRESNTAQMGCRWQRRRRRSSKKAGA